MFKQVILRGWWKWGSWINEKQSLLIAFHLTHDKFKIYLPGTKDTEKVVGKLSLTKPLETYLLIEIRMEEDN
jgi:hypothetical protein